MDVVIKEPLVPVDMSFVADKVNLLTSRAREGVLSQMKSSIPVGYSVVSKSNMVHILRTDGSDLVYPSFSKSRVAHIYVSGQWKGDMHIDSGATPKDIYNICGILQILKGFDSEILGEFKIVN